MSSLLNAYMDPITYVVQSVSDFNEARAIELYRATALGVTFQLAASDTPETIAAAVQHAKEAGLTVNVMLCDTGDFPSINADYGWADESTGSAFVHYVENIASALRGLVQRYITFRRPLRGVLRSHLYGQDSPHIIDPDACFRALHHIVCAHHRAAETIRSVSADNYILFGVEALRPTSFDGHHNLAEIFAKRWLVDAVERGSYPTQVLNHLAEIDIEWTADDPLGELALVYQPTDCIAISDGWTMTPDSGDPLGFVGACPPATKDDDAPNIDVLLEAFGRYDKERTIIVLDELDRDAIMALRHNTPSA